MIKYFLFLLLVPISAFGQVAPDAIDYDKCEYMMIHNNVYAPFYIHVTHDPAIAQTFKARHDDNPNVVPFQRAPEGIDEGAATWFDFGSLNNATATYEFQLDLEYQTPSVKPRLMTIQVFSENNLIMEKKVYQEDLIGCTAFKVHVEPPPHKFTPDEIAQIAGQEVVGITKQYAVAIDRNTEATKGYETLTLVMAIIMSVCLLYVIFMMRKYKHDRKLEAEEYGRRNTMLSVATTQVKTTNSFLLLRQETFESYFTKLSEQMIGTVGVMISDFDKLKSDFRKEIELVINDMREEMQLEQRKFEEIKQVQVPEKDIVVEKTLDVPVVQKDEHHKFPFDLKELIVKPFDLLKKKDEKEISTFDKLKKEWDAKSVDELHKIYEEYLAKANDDVGRLGKHTENYEIVEYLCNLINSRTTDLGNKK